MPRIWHGWGEVAVAMAVTALVCAVYYSFAHYSFDILEEGYFLTNARRVQMGDLPYRDFNAPYTPGIFFVYAWLMEHVNADVVTLRTLHVVARGAFILALYALGRQVTTPFFALLAPALIIGIDTVPGMWSLHPGWFTTPASILGTLAVARYLRTGRLWWLLLAGTACGLAFAFKQNLAAYGTMAALWLLVVFELRLPPVRLSLRLRRHGPLDEAPPAVARRRSAGPVLLAIARTGVQAAALVLLPLVATVIALPYMSSLVAGLFVMPLVALSGIGLLQVMRGFALPPAAQPGSLDRDTSFYLRPAVLLIGFTAVTLAWFLPFFRALDWRADLLGPMVGKIDQTGYFLSMQQPTVEHLRVIGAALLLPVLLPLACALGLWGRRGIALLVGALAWWVLSVSRGSREWSDPWNALDGLAEVRGKLLSASAAYGEQAYTTYDLVLWLPTLIFWLAYLLLLYSLVRRRTDPVRIWLLAAGAALLLNQYPRMDEVHMLWSGGVLFMVGADLLQRWYRLAVRAVPRLRSSALGDVVFKLSMAILPAAAALPIIFSRIDGAGALFRPAASPGELTRPEGPYGLLRLDTPGDRARVWVPGKDALHYMEIAQMLQDKTVPGEPIFTYPAIPGFYYLADRPNATGFNHVFPGMASPPEQLEMVRQLERVNYVIWDDAGAHFWVQPGDNAPVTEYIRTNYRIERFVGPYAVLSRQAVRDWGEPLHYPLPEKKS
jgi:hypothetical protein